MFKHTIILVLIVKPFVLWDSPGLYVWKHLRQNNWKKKNGTSIKVVKVHPFIFHLFTIIYSLVRVKFAWGFESQKNKIWGKKNRNPP